MFYSNVIWLFSSGRGRMVRMAITNFQPTRHSPVSNVHLRRGDTRVLPREGILHSCPTKGRYPSNLKGHAMHRSY